MPEKIDTESEPIDLEENSAIVPEVILSQQEDVPVLEPEPDSSFGNGIIVGIIVGIAIGIVFIFIIRQRPAK